MRVAVPVYTSRVSPLFDTCTTLLVVEFADGAETDRRMLDVRQQHPLSRAGFLQGLGVDVLICSAISGPLHGQIEFSGIRVISGIAGEVDEVITAYVENRLQAEPGFMMPGCFGRGMHRGRSGGRGGLRMGGRGRGGGGRGRGGGGPGGRF